MAKTKTSIYVDGDLWRRFREHSSRRGVEVSKLLEELIEDALVELELDKVLAEVKDDYEIDFDPVEPRGPVSDLVRAVRYERAGSVPG